MVPRPVLQALLNEAVVPIHLFVALIQQSNAISMLPLAICYPTPLPAKLKFNTSREIQPLRGLEEFLSWTWLHQDISLKNLYQVKRSPPCFAAFIFCLPWSKKLLHHVLCFKPRDALKPLFCQGGTVQHKTCNI